MKRFIATLSLVVVSTAAVSVAAPREAHAGKTGTAIAAGIAAGLFSNMLANNLNRPQRTTVIRQQVVQPQPVYVQPQPVVVQQPQVIRTSCTSVVDQYGNLIRKTCY